MVEELCAGAVCEGPGELADSLRIEVLQDRAAVMALRASMEELCQDLCQANVFFEPWFLFPALNHLAPTERLRFLCLYETSGRQRLCGFLPLVESPIHPFLPLRTYQVWAHSQCFRCTPFVRKGFAEQFWRATLGWLESRPWGSRLLHLQRLPAKGELWRALQSALADRPGLRKLLYCYDTALLRTGTSYKETLSKAMSKATRRKIEQQRKRLAKFGSPAFTDTDDGPPIDAVIEEFLQLEASGWKGKAGTALASKPSEAAFFRDVIRAAGDRGRLSFLALRVDGRMIAGQCAFLSPPGAFLFKTAYDESFGMHSPGTLLDMEETRRMHDSVNPLRAELTWADSCAGPGDGPRCWSEYMPVARYRITTAWTIHALVIGLWPPVRSIANLFFKSDKAAVVRQ